MLLQTSPMFNSYSLCPGGQTLKRQTWYIWSLRYFDEIAQRSLFCSSLSTVSLSPDECAPSVSTTLSYSTLASDEAVSSRTQQPGEAVEEAGGSRRRARLNDPACESLRPACAFVLPLSLPAWLLLLWSWTAKLLLQSWGDSQLLSRAKKEKQEKKKTKKRREEINSSLKECIKRCSTFTLATPPGPCDLEDAGLHLTNHTCAGWGRKCCFCLDW